MSDEPQAAAQETPHIDDVRGLLERAADAAESAAGGGEPRLRLHRLSPEDSEELLAATTTYVQQLRPPRRGSRTPPLAVEQEVHGWWALLLGYADARRRQRLNPLRNEVFAALAEAGVVRRAGPDDAASDWKVVAPEQSAAGPLVTRETLGAWVLKVSPQVWDVARWVAEGGTPLTDWSVSHNYRSRLMAPGDRVLLWVSGHDQASPAGFRAAGTVTGACVASSAGSDYWLDRKARERADLFVPLDLRLLPDLVPKPAVQHHRVLRGIEVLRSPFASNPSHLTREELAALEPMLGP